MKAIFSKLVVLLLVSCAFAAATAVNAQKMTDKAKAFGPAKTVKPIRKAANSQKNKAADPQKEKGKDKDKDKETEQSEKSMAVSPDVAVIFCGGSGTIYVHGWDKPELRAIGESGTKVNLIAAKINKDAPVSQVTVTLKDQDPDNYYKGRCASNSNLELYVPRGAFVDLTTQEGDATVEKVAKARLNSLSGSFTLSGITASIRANTTSGDITVDNSSGEISLRALSGTVDVRNVKPASPGDFLSANTSSGDVNLDRVGYLSVDGGSISGDVSLFGALTKGATYKLHTTSGDVTTALPATSSFSVEAIVFSGGEIICDFPIKKPTTGGNTPPERTITRLRGTYGTGDSVLILTAVNGTIHLRKK